MCTCKFVFVNMCMCMPAYMHVCMLICLYTCVCMLIYLYTCVWVCTCERLFFILLYFPHPCVYGEIEVDARGVTSVTPQSPLP